ncbi:unnamed protein product [Amoebophrya sp. A25]|nr:unnamed protein product [Amoebophrya sp. A25]|eukprot:GSA25T00021623001.1
MLMQEENHEQCKSDSKWLAVGAKEVGRGAGAGSFISKYFSSASARGAKSRQSRGTSERSFEDEEEQRREHVQWTSKSGEAGHATTPRTPLEESAAFFLRTMRYQPWPASRLQRTFPAPIVETARAVMNIFRQIGTARTRDLHSHEQELLERFRLQVCATYAVESELLLLRTALAELGWVMPGGSEHDAPKICHPHKLLLQSKNCAVMSASSTLKAFADGKNINNTLGTPCSRTYISPNAGPRPDSVDLEKIDRFNKRTKSAMLSRNTTQSSIKEDTNSVRENLIKAMTRTNFVC